MKKARFFTNISLYLGTVYNYYGTLIGNRIDLSTDEIAADLETS